MTIYLPPPPQKKKRANFFHLFPTLSALRGRLSGRKASTDLHQRMPWTTKRRCQRYFLSGLLTCNAEVATGWFDWFGWYQFMYTSLPIQVTYRKVARRWAGQQSSIARQIQGSGTAAAVVSRSVVWMSFGMAAQSPFRTSACCERTMNDT